MESVESRMTAQTSEHFMVKFDGAEAHGIWTAWLEMLENAYREIGQKFGHFPSKSIVVVLHTRDLFQGANISGKSHSNDVVRLVRTIPSSVAGKFPAKMLLDFLRRGTSQFQPAGKRNSIFREYA